MTDIYFQIVKPMSTDELLAMASNPRKYQSTLVDAAKQELTHRGIDFSKLEKTESKENETTENTNNNKDTHYSSIREQHTKKTIAVGIDIPKTEDSFHSKKQHQYNFPNSNLPLLYSKEAILICTLLSSVLFGGILFSLNLKALKRDKFIYPIMVFAIVFMMCDFVLMEMFWRPFSLILGILFNLLGGLMLYKVFWTRYIGDSVQYQSKSIVKILIIYTIIIGTIAILFILWLYSVLKHIL